MIHLSPQADVNLKLILQELTPRLSDSVKLSGDPRIGAEIAHDQNGWSQACRNDVRQPHLLE
jgi:hypothetical protein